MPNTSNTSAPQKRASFSRLAVDSVSAEQTSFLTEEAARSMPFASARLARCSAKLLMPMNTVGRNVWIKSSCAAEGYAFPAPAQIMPTPKSCALRAQTCPAGCTPSGNEM